ncbi:MAG TPA: hypothetical protein VNA16_10920, partial [Abditibacteriaceae bacterium]|nr:hypothetical protein [Abditibacteriaceae bacterium]
VIPAMLIILGFELLLAAVNLDVQAVPRQPLSGAPVRPVSAPGAAVVGEAVPVHHQAQHQLDQAANLTPGHAPLPTPATPSQAPANLLASGDHRVS